jgi:anaerobic magnesium-protoporphyrin IX monomethyl ester cyclase
MPKIDCLFITSSKTGAIQFSIYPYLGVGYLMSFLKKKNLTARLFDADVNKNSLKKLIAEIENYNPTVIGYSVMSMSLPFFYTITKEIRKRFPEVIIAAGGPHVTNDPEIIFEMNIDFGFVGHSEESFPLFLEKIKNNNSDFSNIDGIVIGKTKRIDQPLLYDVSLSYEFPDYSLYDLTKYQNISYGRRWFTVITSRGCAYNCKFCKDPGKNKYKEYPLESVKNQIKILVKEHKMHWLTFVDDSFTYNRARVIELCKWIIDEGLVFKWTCMTRVDVLDHELIQIMRNAGLQYVIVGVEAGNEEIRKGINKFISNSQYIDIIGELRKNGIRVLCSYVLGNPGENYSHVRQTINFSNKLNADYSQYYNMMALPQSPIIRLGIEEGLFKENIWTDYMKGESGLPFYVPLGLKLSKLKRMKLFAFIRYYTKPRKFFDLGIRLIKFFFDISFRSN